MFDEQTSLGGEIKEKEQVKVKKLTRAQRIAAWRKANEADYNKACHEAHCTCTPTRAQMLIMDNWRSPPVD